MNKIKCPNCNKNIKRQIWVNKFECPKCGSILKIENQEAKQFISMSETILIFIGFISNSLATYILIAALMIIAMIIYVGWSLYSPISLIKRGTNNQLQ